VTSREAPSCRGPPARRPAGEQPRAEQHAPRRNTDLGGGSATLKRVPQPGAGRPMADPRRTSGVVPESLPAAERVIIRAASMVPPSTSPQQQRGPMSTGA